MTLREDHNHKFGLPVPSPQMIERARQLRQRTTDAEQLMWELLRGRQLNGLKFRRQHPIGNFIADFCCGEHRLVVELDGAVHLEQPQAARDRVRDAIMQEHDLRVLRFTNAQVCRETESVLEQILRAAAVPSPPTPLPIRCAGEGRPDARRRRLGLTDALPVRAPLSRAADWERGRG